MPLDNQVGRTTSPWLSCAGTSRLLAVLLTASLTASAQQTATLQAGAHQAAPLQTATLRIRPVNGDKLQSSVGLPPPSKLIVIVEDSLGVPIPLATVSFRLPDSPLAGVFANGLRTEIATTGSDGRASSSPVHWPASPIAVRVTAAKGDLRAGVVVTVEGLKSASAQPPASLALVTAASPSSPAPSAAQAEPAAQTNPKPIVLGASMASKPPQLAPVTPTPVDLVVPKYEPPSFWRNKWFLVAVTAGGALTAGFFAARPRSQGGVSAPTPVTPGGGGAISLPVTIGPPTVVIGKP